MSEAGTPWSIHANQKLPVSKFIENRQHIMGNKNILALLAKTLQRVSYDDEPELMFYCVMVYNDVIQSTPYLDQKPFSD